MDDRWPCRAAIWSCCRADRPTGCETSPRHPSAGSTTSSPERRRTRAVDSATEETARLPGSSAEAEGETVDPALHALPPVVRVGGVNGEPAPWVEATLRLVAVVTSSEQPGSEAVLARLAETMVLQTLRTELAELASTDPGRVEALHDPQIAAAIQLIHSRPDLAWTVERLASEVGYSRSAFAERFRELVGESPIAYLTRSRLAIAATELDRTDLTITEIARRVGYANQASFSRAFGRVFGVAPGAYRKGIAQIA